MKTITLGVNQETGQPFTIPLQGAATKTIGVFGKKGSGKTFTTAVWVEQLIANKIPVVVLDPVGRWWDLGLSADGKSPGFPIAIFGGQRGQVPLTPDMGAAIARYVSEKHVPTVVDLSFESKTTWRKVVADFCETLFRVNTLPIHVVIEEAPEFIPQRIFGENATVFGAVDKLVRLGRNRGIGMTVIGQRLQTTNKDTVSQVDALIVLRLVDPQGKKAAREWVMAKGEEEHADEFVDALASLKSGNGYVWSPEWLEAFAPVRFGARQTFHYDADRAAAETKPTGEIARAVDTDELVREFAKFSAPVATEKPSGKPDAQSARVIADLRAQIESLNAALETAQAQAVSEEEIAHRIEGAVQNATAELRSRLAQFESFVSTIAGQAQVLVGGEIAVAEFNPLVGNVGLVNKVAALVKKSSTRLKTTERKVFETLGNLYPDFPNGVVLNQLAVESGYAPTGAYIRALTALTKRRLIVRSGGVIKINPELLR